MKLILAAILLAATLIIGFNALNTAFQSSEESYASQSLANILTTAKMVTNGAVGSKQLVPIKLVGNSKISFANEILDGVPQGRIDIQLSNGNTLIEVIQLPINYIQRDGVDIGDMKLSGDTLVLSGSGDTRKEIFLPQGEYKLVLVHQRADDTSWNPGSGTNYLEISLY